MMKGVCECVSECVCVCVWVCVCVHSSDESTIFQITLLIFDETPCKILLCLVEIEIALSALPVVAVSNLNYEKYSIATVAVKCVCVFVRWISNI
jgi:hypothetical protein